MKEVQWLDDFCTLTCPHWLYIYIYKMMSSVNKIEQVYYSKVLLGCEICWSCSFLEGYSFTIHSKNLIFIHSQPVSWRMKCSNLSTWIYVFLRRWTTCLSRTFHLFRNAIVAKIPVWTTLPLIIPAQMPC